MFINKSEAHERVLSAVEDVKNCCEVADSFFEWDDVAASSITAFLEDLTAEQLDDTCGVFVEYIEDTAKTDSNLAQGIKSALVIALSEMLDYIGDVPEAAAAGDDGEDEDSDFYGTEDRETAQLVSAIKSALDDIKSITL